jgi:hypothetical protein
MAIIIPSGQRPAFSPAGETIKGASSTIWSAPLAYATDALARALRATARLETSDKNLEFIGTAFAVTPTLAAVTGHIAQLMLRKREDGKETFYSLNFFADDSDARTSIGAWVKLVHPYFDFALLEMERSVEADSILQFSARIPEIGEDVALIGYPLYDRRNDIDAVTALFGDVFGKKRVMPGRVTSASATVKTGEDEVPALAHDASCTSGTSGAPVIQLSTGQVVGVHFAGAYLERNFAVPAWELARDPFLQVSELQFVGSVLTPPWLSRWKRRLSIVDTKIEAASKKPLLPGIPPAKLSAHLLTADEIDDVKDILVRAGFGAACTVKKTDAGMKAALEKYYAILSKQEEVLKQTALQPGQGVTSLAIPQGADFRRIATTIARLGEKSIVLDGLTKEELASPVRNIQITFQGEREGLKMLRDLAPRGKIRPYKVEEKEGGLVLIAKEDP